LFDDPSDGDYDVEYRTIGAEDGRLRWVRAKGKVYFEEGGQPIRFIGSVLDITDQKINEQRKNDFIAMVSHELKTPLTSLKAYIQLLMRSAPETGESVERDILTRANVQAQKMVTLINGFLNLSRFELGKLELQSPAFALDELIRQVIADTKAERMSPALASGFISAQRSFDCMVARSRLRARSVSARHLVFPFQSNSDNRSVGKHITPSAK
jgi:signal transduction histidine kinase